ncbi:MAG: hypothetical protein VB934_05655 [Polyangiaceae bacterium]
MPSDAAAGDLPKDHQHPDCRCAWRSVMAGNGAFCCVRVTRREFDWVLSRIEQDEDYV